jgi:hypothetical protein
LLGERFLAVTDVSIKIGSGSINSGYCSSYLEHDAHLLQFLQKRGYALTIRKEEREGWGKERRVF